MKYALFLVIVGAAVSWGVITPLWTWLEGSDYYRVIVWGAAFNRWEKECLRHLVGCLHFLFCFLPCLVHACHLRALCFHTRILVSSWIVYYNHFVQVLVKGMLFLAQVYTWLIYQWFDLASIVSKRSRRESDCVCAYTKLFQASFMWSAKDEWA